MKTYEQFITEANLYTKETQDGWQHTRALGRRRWTKGNHSVERQGKRGWTVYDMHRNKELHLNKTAKGAKAWSNANRTDSTAPAKIHIQRWTA
jgi:hypothetical protein